MSKHVLVLGAGIVGLSIADELLDAGYKVTVVDKDKKFGDGCSFGNGGLIVPSHFVPLAAPGMIATGLKMMLDKRSPFGVAQFTDFETLSWMARFAMAATKSHTARCSPVLRDMNLASRSLYEKNLAEMAVEVGYAHRGLLMLSRTQAGQDGESHLADDANKIGLKAKVLSKEEVAKLEPDVPMNIAGAVLFEDDAHLSPDGYMQAVAKRIVDRGGELKFGVEAKRFVATGGKIERLETSAGDLTADEFVLAGGAWSGELAKTFGLKMPLRAGRGFNLVAHNPPHPHRIPAILTEARVAVTPMLDGVRFVGTLELGKPEITAPSARVDAMRENILAYYPAYKASDFSDSPWCGLRPCSPDGMPYLGRTQKANNLVVATGHAMMGMSLGPVSGRLVRDILTGTTPTVSLDLMSPDRYA